MDFFDPIEGARQFQRPAFPGKEWQLIPLGTRQIRSADAEQPDLSVRVLMVFGHEMGYAHQKLFRQAYRPGYGFGAEKTSKIQLYRQFGQDLGRGDADGNSDPRMPLRTDLERARHGDGLIV